MPKKPGGQLKNKNAFKHGFYAKYFNAFENRALSRLPLTDMTGEIGLLRVNVDRFMQAYTASLDDLDYENRLAGLRAITLAVGRIAALQRILTSAAKYQEDDAKIQEFERGLQEDFDKWILEDQQAHA